VQCPLLSKLETKRCKHVHSQASLGSKIRAKTNTLALSIKLSKPDYNFRKNCCEKSTPSQEKLIPIFFFSVSS